MNNRPPHPLALTIAKKNTEAPALLVGIGNGRNLPILLESGHLIIAVDESETLVSHWQQHTDARLSVRLLDKGVIPVADAAVGLILATHVLQHGTRSTLIDLLREFARVCKPEAAAAFVFASIADARYGSGVCLEPQCYAPTEGDEIGVPHIYLTEEQIYELLSTHFIIDNLEHVDADTIAGSWAHQKARGLRHYFVHARRNDRV